MMPLLCSKAAFARVTAERRTAIAGADDCMLRKTAFAKGAD